MIYKGKLGHKYMEGWAKVAYSRYHHQLRRCINPKAHNYEWYGGKGIRVEYSTREFIGWFISEIKNFKGKKPCVGRIDHSKNYTLDNIEMIEHSENSKEPFSRSRKPPNPTRGSKNNLSKRTEEEVIKIKKMINEGIPMKKISILTGVPYVTITVIKRGIIWGHLVA